tara:strand:- start:19 stop:300 length:282 start_codon:yes stop_codon:yes gene_type:complete
MKYKLPTPEELGVINQRLHFGSTVYNDGTIAKKINIEFDTSTNMVLFWDNMAPDEDEIRSMNFDKNEIEIQEYVEFDFHRHEVFMFWNKTEEE